MEKYKQTNFLSFRYLWYADGKFELSQQLITAIIRNDSHLELNKQLMKQKNTS